MGNGGDVRQRGLDGEELEKALEHDAAVPVAQRTDRQHNNLAEAIEKALAHLDVGEVEAARALLQNAVARMRAQGVWL